MAVWFWYFVFYSFLGFLLEVGFARVTRSPKRDRKCFYLLPLCPVYGLGALLILWVTGPVREWPWLAALLAGLAASSAEYLMGLFYQWLGVAFWDYSHLPLNLGGKVCLFFSLAWAILGLAVIDWIHPMLGWVELLPPWLTLPAMALTALDGGYSLLLLRRSRTTDVLMWYRRAPGAAAL